MNIVFSIVIHTRCRNCTRVLDPDDKSHCKPCKKTRARSARKRRKKEDFKKWNRLRAARMRAKDRKGYNKRVADFRMRRLIEQKCRMCKEDSLEDSAFCEKHRDRTNQSSRDYRKRRKEKVCG